MPFYSDGITHLCSPMKKTAYRIAWLVLAGSLVSTWSSQPNTPPSPLPLPASAAETQTPKRGTIEVVAELPINPGNVTVSKDGRIFSTVHQFRRGDAQLIEVTGFNTYKPFPNQAWNAKPGSGNNVLHSVLGIVLDEQNRLWVIDNGNVEGNLQTPKLVAFDTKTGKVAFRYDFPESTAAKGTFLQDLAVDAKRGFVYIADIGGQFKPAIVVVDINKKTSRRFTGHPSLNAEDVNLVVDGVVAVFPNAEGKIGPARVAINPITLSADGETLYYGAMTGKTWWQVSTAPLRNGSSNKTIAATITKAGEKPVSDGASTDAEGNHFFTHPGANAIDVLSKDGKLTRLVQDDRLEWPDSVRFGQGSWLYIAVNQLNRSPMFTGGEERGKPPYRIMRVWTGSRGITGR
jgi:sugar lactone lactonase YvrE